MFVITVAPIKRGIPADELSYFSRTAVPSGALVRVPLRGRLIPGLVIDSTPAEDHKTELRRAGYVLKKLDRVHATRFFSPAFIAAAIETSRFHATSAGAVIQALFPNALLTGETAGLSKLSAKGPRERRDARLVLQAEEAERFATHKSQIREVFARGGSCYFVLPSIQDIEHVYGSLEKGIREYTFILHSGLSRREMKKRWNAVAKNEHPVLIIGTPTFLAVPRSDLECIILEHESSSAYMREGRPHLDMRYFVEAFARHSGARLILGDLFLRIETLHRLEAGELESIMRPKFRLQSTARQSVVDMRASGEQPATGRIAVCSRMLVDRIEEARAKGGHCFILGVRRGYSPMTVCGDCGTIVSCGRCSAPMVLHKRSAKGDEDERDAFVFLCHRCGTEGRSDRTCTHCGGWRLVPLGIGTAQAQEAIEKRFPGITLVRLDRDTVKDHKEAIAKITKFYGTPGSVLLGTEMAIPYLTEPVSTVAVLSVNSLLTMPDFRMGERVFRLLLSLRERAREHFIIQTRDAETPLFSLATGGNIGEFLREELAERERLGYPPFSTIIKFTFEGKRADGEAIMAEIERIFGIYHPVTFPAFIARVKGKFRLHALIKVPKGAWPNEEILSLARSLPSEVEVRVNPESVI